MEQYYSEGEYTVAKAVLTELLYMLGKCTHTPIEESYNSRYMRDVVKYINQNLSSDLSLNSLSAQFHISPSHISRLLKKHMKMSVKKYITYKRLLLAKELFAEGMSLLDASSSAGFQNYSNFYRMYIKEFGVPPSTLSRRK